jgi:trigger factor
VDEAFAKSLGIKDGTVRGPARRRQEEPRARGAQFACWRATRRAVMDALVKAQQLDVPKALVSSETERLTRPRAPT